MTARVAVLISGRGSNMQALARAAAAPGFPAEIAAVLSDVPDAPGLAWAQDNGLKTEVVDRRACASRAAFDAALAARIADVAPDLICLAGFMRVLDAAFVRAHSDRMLNIHPSLLPAFKGLDTHRRALEAGVSRHGCTVHFVDPELDSGPIVAQTAVPVRPEDDEAALAARVLAAEHRLYPACLAAVAQGDVRRDGATVIGAIPDPRPDAPDAGTA